MRLIKPIALALLAILTVSTSTWAQSSTRNPIASPVQNVISQAQSAFAPTATSPPATSPSVLTQPAFGSAVPQTQFGSATPFGSPVPAAASIPYEYSGQVAAPAMSYTGPASGSFGGGSYGPVNVGQYPQGCPHCDLSPTPNVVPCLKPVTSCCSQNGRLGIPPLLTPIRYDMPPVGRAVGRPLFGAWQGY